MKPGMILLYTGDGKGKTTAAFGQAMRAIGQGLRVCIIQFIKASRKTGEAKAMKYFGEQAELHVAGSGFTWEAKDHEQLRKTAVKAWQLACDKITHGGFDMIVLDEITYLPAFELLEEQKIIEMLKKRPPAQHIVITGRNPGKKLIDLADLVTEMHEIKHPFRKGTAARKGIEF